MTFLTLILSFDFFVKFRDDHRLTDLLVEKWYSEKIAVLSEKDL